MNFLKKKSALYVIALLVLLATVISPIVISWGSFTLRTFFKLPVNSNAVTILGGVTGMWGSIFGGLIGGALTFFGVLFTIERERDTNKKVHYQGQLGAAVFLSLEIEILIDNILAARNSIITSLEAKVPFGYSSRDELFKKFGFRFLDRFHDWSTYIEKIQDVTLQRELWIVYKNFIKIEEKVYRDISDLHYKKQEILSQLPDNYTEIPSINLIPRQKFLVGQLNTLTLKISISEIIRKRAWEAFENTDYLESIDPIKTKLDKLINDIQATFERE